MAAHDPVARLEAGDARADGDDLAGGFVARERRAAPAGTGICRRASARRHTAHRAPRCAPASRPGRAAAGRAPRATPAPRDRRTPRTPSLSSRIRLGSVAPMLSPRGEGAQPAVRPRPLTVGSHGQPMASGVPSRACFRLNPPREQRNGGAPMIDKFVRSVAEAMAGIKDGSTVLIAGFGPGRRAARADRGPDRAGRQGPDRRAQHRRPRPRRGGAADRRGRVRKIMCSFARAAAR